MAIFVLLSFFGCKTQSSHSKTETVTIYGNCEICKTSIEKAGNSKNIATVNWNKDTKEAILIYNSQKTNRSEILKRIALAGYDSDSFLAPDNAYNKLPTCCLYERKAKTAPLVEVSKMDTLKTVENHSDHSNHNSITDAKTPQLKAIFENYFFIKDALVKTDGKLASEKATNLLAAIKAVKMEKLTTDEHNAFMKVVKNLTLDAQTISKSKDAELQRKHFSSLSMNIYALIKVSQNEQPIYLQHCPMANNGKGADWLSKENTIKNPYFGSMMLNCGKTTETIK